MDYQLLMSILSKNMTEGADERTVQQVVPAKTVDTRKLWVQAVCACSYYFFFSDLSF